MLHFSVHLAVLGIWVRCSKGNPPTICVNAWLASGRFWECMVLASCMDSIYVLLSRLSVSYKMIWSGFDCESERWKRPFAEKTLKKKVLDWRRKLGTPCFLMNQVFLRSFIFTSDFKENVQIGTSPSSSLQVASSFWRKYLTKLSIF